MFCLSSVLGHPSLPNLILGLSPTTLLGWFLTSFQAPKLSCGRQKALAPAVGRLTEEGHFHGYRAIKEVYGFESLGSRYSSKIRALTTLTWDLAKGGSALFEVSCSGLGPLTT